MGKLIFIICLILLICIALFALRRYRRGRALVVVQNASQKQVDTAIKVCLPNVKTDSFDGSLHQNIIDSEIISDVWGKGVMAFEYSISKIHLKVEDIVPIRQQLSQQLKNYADKNNLKGYQGMDAFVISDMWIFSDALHIDISYVINRSTAEYLHDIKAPEREK